MRVRRCLAGWVGGEAVLAAVATIAAGVPAGAVTSSAPEPAGAIIRIAVHSPRNGGSYQLGARVLARFRCSKAGVPRARVSCRGTVPDGRAVDTSSAGTKSFTVIATDRSGDTLTHTVHYKVWRYVNPLRDVLALRPSRIDMGVDYSGYGPILAIGEGRVVSARYVPGPESCWGRTCAPAPGGWVVYRLLRGPFAGRYVYAVENITPVVKVGQIVHAGQGIAVLHDRSPNLEIGWAAGRKAETLAMADGHQCTCTDPGGWSTVEGRNFNALLVWLGAPSGYRQETPPQRMPRGWPALPRRT
jgi:hypothetical protein